MNPVSSGQPVQDESDDYAEFYELELKAAQQHLGADTSDLVYLLSFIHQQEVSRHQVQGLLEKAYSRLQALRMENPELDSNLADADQALEQKYRLCIERKDQFEDAARICAQQAQIAAVTLNFRHAAALFAKAAATADIALASRWHYLYQQALMLEDLGREFLDIEALQAAVDLYENTIVPMTLRQDQPDDWSSIQFALGTTLGILGQRQRGTRMLENSIAAFERALTVQDRERTPVDWGSTQNGLGNSLGILAQRQHDQEMLEKSVSAFEAALKVRSSEQFPGDWATTQNNLAAVLLSLGQQKKDSKMLKRAVDSYKAVLTVWVREQQPLIWGATMNNLGTALRLLGEHRKGPRTLEQSVAAYNAALSVRIRERVPHDWAMTQNNLGAALQVLGERLDDVVALGRSVAAYREAIKEWTRENEPMSWAMALANLGVARRKLAERNQDIDISRRAIDDLKMAVDVFRGASHAQLTELGEEQLSLARKLTTSLQADS